MSSLDDTAAAAATNAPIPAMDLSLGCMLIGVFMNVLLYGMSIVQGYLYLVNFKSDKLFMRIFVCMLLLADTLNCIFDTGFIYKYLISNFGDLDYAVHANSLFAADPVMTSIIALSCQTFFAWRVYRLMHSWWCPALIVTTGTVSFLSAIGTTIGVKIVGIFTEFQKFQVVVILWLACAALTDIIITIALIWTLQKSRTGFTATDDVITRLIRGTLQTGLATTVFAIADLVLFCASTTTLHLVFNLPLAKLYVNSLLGTLNARAMMTTANRNTLESDGKNSSGPHQTIRKTGRQSRFQPTGSVNDAVSSPSRGNFFGGNKNGLAAPGGRLDLEAGIQVTTIEERFEEPHELTQMASLAHRNAPHRHLQQQPPRFPRSQSSRDTLEDDEAMGGRGKAGMSNDYLRQDMM